MKELEEAKADLVETEKRHKEVITRLERKFFEEKFKMQSEANHRIADLAIKAHRVIN